MGPWPVRDSLHLNRIIANRTTAGIDIRLKSWTCQYLVATRKNGPVRVVRSGFQPAVYRRQPLWHNRSCSQQADSHDSTTRWFTMKLDERAVDKFYDKIKDMADSLDKIETWQQKIQTQTDELENKLGNCESYLKDIQKNTK
jgi:hypothetical protein